MVDGVAFSPAVGASGKPIREKIALMGAAGTGKTAAVMATADLSQSTGATRTFFIMETDRSQAIERYLETTHSHLKNIEHRPATDWRTQLATIETWLKAAGSEDFLVVDLFAPAFYDESQTMADEEMNTMTLKAREEAGTARYWNAVRSYYKRLTNNVLAWPGHIIGTTGVKKAWKTKDEEMSTAFAVEVDGHAATRHLFLTNIIMLAVRKGDYRATTIKDVGGRRYLEGEGISDFSFDYLISVANWSL